MTIYAKPTTPKPEAIASATSTPGGDGVSGRVRPPITSCTGPTTPKPEAIARATSTPGGRFYRPQGVGVRISYRCNIGCSHCYNDSLPGNDVTIHEGRLMGVIEEGRRRGLRNVGVTGGEAMLHSKLVLGAYKYARDIGYDGAQSLMTNGFWGRTEKSARNMVRMLAEAGFNAPPDVINLSSGEYHQEWIPTSSIRNIVKAFHDQFKAPLNLDFEFTKGNDALLQKLLDDFDKHGVPEEGYRLRLRTNITLMGRGQGLSVGDKKAVPGVNYGRCPGLNKFILNPDGKVMPCCGFNRFNRGITVGDVYKNTVDEIIDATEYNIIYQYLLHKRLGDLHAIVSRKFKLKDSYTSGSQCEACEDIFGKEEHVAYLESVAKQELGDLMRPGSRPGSTVYFHEDENVEFTGRSATGVELLVRPNPFKDREAAAKTAARAKAQFAAAKEKATMPQPPKPPTQQPAAAPAPVAKPQPAGGGLDLSKMSITTLERLIDEASALRDKKFREERDLRIRQVKHAAREYRIDLRELHAEMVAEGLFPAEETKTGTSKTGTSKTKTATKRAAPRKTAKTKAKPAAKTSRAKKANGTAKPATAKAASPAKSTATKSTATKATPAKSTPTKSRAKAKTARPARGRKASGVETVAKMGATKTEKAAEATPAT